MQALWMVLGAFWFATMAVGIKFASHSFSTAELVFYRGLVSVLFMAIVVRARGVQLRTTLPMMHLWRSAVGVMSLGLWFYAIAHLPLATAMTLNYMSAVWVAAFVVGGALLYGNAQNQGPLLGTVMLGFVGVAMTLQPTIGQDQLFAGVLGLLSGMSAALAYVQVGALGRLGEPEERTVFYFSIGTALAGGMGMLFTNITPWAQVRWQDAAWLVPIGVFASLGQWCMTRAYRQGATLVVASLQYSGIVFSVAYGLWLFEDHMSTVSWLGMGVIVISGILATLLRQRAMPKLPVAGH
jgi:S-adenosylmethionine uptake transporter